MDNSIAEQLKDLIFFKEIPDHLLETLIKNSKSQLLKNNDLLFHEQQTGERFYFLLSGSIKLYKSNNQGKEVVIKIVQPHELFAELIIFESDKYPVSAVAIKKSEVLAIHRDQFKLILKDPMIRDRFITSLMQRMRYLTNRLQYIQSEDVRTRFFRFITEKYGDSGHYNVKLAKKEIAFSIGTIPETFSRMIKCLIKENKITWNKNELIFLDKKDDTGICVDIM